MNQIWLFLTSIKFEQCNETCSKESDSLHGIQKDDPSLFSKTEWVMYEWPICGRHRSLLFGWNSGIAGIRLFLNRSCAVCLEDSDPVIWPEFSVTIVQRWFTNGCLFPQFQSTRTREGSVRLLPTRSRTRLLRTQTLRTHLLTTNSSKVLSLKPVFPFCLTFSLYLSALPFCF